LCAILGGWYLAADRTTHREARKEVSRTVITMTPFTNALTSGAGVNRRRPVLLAL
jgi:hypothetical protein